MKADRIERLDPPLPLCERCHAEPLTTTRRLCNYCWTLDRYEREEAASGVPSLALRRWKALR